MIYQLYQAHSDMIAPLRAMARLAVCQLNHVKAENLDDSVTRRFSALCSRRAPWT